MQFAAMAASAMQVIGTLTAGNTADKVAGRNARELNQRADASLRASGTREDMLRERNRQALSSQRAAMLANGVDPGSGSALVGSEQNMRDAEMDALTMRYQGLLEARDMRSQADMVRWEGKAKKKQSRFDAVSQLISSSGSYMSQRQMPAPVESRTPTPSPYYKG